MIDVEITIPAETFEFGEILRPPLTGQIELERLVPIDDGYAVLIWVVGEDRTKVETRIRDHHAIQTMEVQMTRDERTLLDVRLVPHSGPITDAILDAQATVIDVVGTTETWNLRLGFLAHDDLTTFHEYLTTRGIPVTLQHVRTSDVDPRAWDSDDDAVLTSAQREAVALAQSRGYFHVPRRTTISDLADELEISDSAFSQRLRRGLSTILDDEVASRTSRNL